MNLFIYKQKLFTFYHKIYCCLRERCRQTSGPQDPPCSCKLQAGPGYTRTRNPPDPGGRTGRSPRRSRPAEPRPRHDTCPCHALRPRRSHSVSESSWERSWPRMLASMLGHIHPCENFMMTKLSLIDFWLTLSELVNQLHVVYQDWFPKKLPSIFLCSF